MTQAVGSDWYIVIDGAPTGPVSAADLSAMVMKRHVGADNLVWCEGLADWTPIGAVLGASERPAPIALTHTVHVEAAERRRTAHRVVSLSRLYVEQLAERALTAIPRPSSAFIAEAHDFGGIYLDADNTHADAELSFDQASAHYVVEPPPRRAAASLQPELATLARLVEVSEASVERTTAWSDHEPGTAVARYA